MVRKTDAAFLLEVLSDGEPHTTNEVLELSRLRRGCGLTVHSRAAQLRKDGHLILCESQGKVNGRSVYTYQLLSPSPTSAALQSDPHSSSQQGHAEDGRGAAEVPLFELPASAAPEWA